MRFDDYVDAVTEAFQMLAEGRCESSVPLQVSVADGTFHAKAASLPRGPGYVAVKVNGNFPDNRSRRRLPCRCEQRSAAVTSRFDRDYAPADRGRHSGCHPVFGPAGFSYRHDLRMRRTRPHSITGSAPQARPHAGFCLGHRLPNLTPLFSRDGGGTRDRRYGH